MKTFKHDRRCKH